MVDTAEAFTVLLDRVRAGDEEALMQLMEQNASYLQRAATAMIGRVLQPHLDSEDVVQSVCCSLLIGYRQEKYAFSDQRTFLALARTLLQRKIARSWRRLKHEPGVGNDTVHDDQSLTQVFCSQKPDAGADLADELKHILRDFDDLDHRLVQLRLEGYSTASAARELGIDPHFLRARLARLRKRLRDEGRIDDWF
jgi:RNA polymerase sigma factor (sigma-70 family)